MAEKKKDKVELEKKILPVVKVRGKKYEKKVQVDISFEDLVKLTVTDTNKDKS